MPSRSRQRNSTSAAGGCRPSTTRFALSGLAWHNPRVPASAPQLRFLYVDSGELIAHARTLFREYQTEIGVDLCFQGFENELARLPGDYAPPGGRLIVALYGAEIRGMRGAPPVRRACR